MTKRTTLCGLAILAAVASSAAPAGADQLRNVRRGEPIPAFRLPTIDGQAIEIDQFKGSVMVLVCISAEQRRSELAAMDSAAVASEFETDDVQLIHITADAIHKAYYEEFRRDRGIDAPLAFDADRRFFSDLGLIVYPTTIVVDREGRLANVISLHGSDYRHVLDAYIEHALGRIDDDQLDEEISRREATGGTPKSQASAHRALARLARERGRLELAYEELSKAREQDPGNREILLDIADLDLTLGKLDEAESIVSDVLEEEPSHRRAKELKGIAHFKRGELDEAEAVLQETINLNPRPEVAHYYLGMICEQRGDHAGAVAHYREALQRLLHEPVTSSAGEDGE